MKISSAPSKEGLEHAYISYNKGSNKEIKINDFASKKANINGGGSGKIE